MSRPPTHAHAVLTTPELLYGIFGHLSTSDLARSSQVMQSFFYCASSVLWKDLKGISKLLHVIPGVTFAVRVTSSYRYSAANGGYFVCKIITINLPEAFSMTRFNYYRTLIQSLNVFDDDVPTAYTLGDGWESLEKHQTDQPDGLLPNLFSLTSLNTSYYQDLGDWVRLLLLFIGPRLEDIRVSHRIIHGKTTSDDSPTSTSLISKISTCCSRLRTLHILLQDEPGCLYDLASLSCLRNLRCLATTIDIIFMPDVLGILGQLPYLTNLAIGTHSAYGKASHTNTLPDAAFPALRTLEVEFTHPRMLGAIWNIASLVINISHAQAKLRFERFSSHSFPDWVESALQTICLNSPSLQHLQLDIRGRHDKLAKVTVPSLRALNALTQLKSIGLMGITLANGATMTELASSLPRVEVFKLTPQEISFDDLYELAIHLPRLRKIIVCFKYPWSLPTLAKNIASPISLLPVVVQGDRWPSVCGCQYLLQEAAAFLYSMWPNVCCVASPEHDPDELHAQSARRLNEAFDRLRGNQVFHGN
ncbi:hypothetical protein FRC08_018005 [Ceratobasidium sp. 394]|nr:hypothetical protein FRC08_018005 [Ceratobasidium sp. 394]